MSVLNEQYDEIYCRALEVDKNAENDPEEDPFRSRYASNELWTNLVELIDELPPFR